MGKRKYEHHGLSKHKLYQLRKNIKNRCYNKNTHNYNSYGGRGITICDEWRYNFKNFFDFCIKNGWSENLQIDRIDNDKNYSPDNCRFITNKENNLNKSILRKDNKSGFLGVHYKKNQKTYCAAIGINYNTKCIGLFKSAKCAAIARDKFVINNNLIGYRLNFPNKCYNRNLLKENKNA